MNNFDYLFRTRKKNLKYKKGRIATFTVCLILFLLVDIFFVLMCAMNSYDPGYEDFVPNPYENFIYSGIFKIINSIIIISFAAIFTSLIYRDEMDNNIVSLELRQGYNEKDGFLSRLSGYVAEVAVFLGSLILINILFIGVQNKFSDPVEYQFFISSLGWYAIILFISSALGIFFSTFCGVAISIVVVFIISVLITVMGAMGILIYQNAMSIRQPNGPSVLDARWDDGIFTAKQSIYNPVLQWSFMWNGLHYGKSTLVVRNLTFNYNYIMYDDFSQMAGIWPLTPKNDPVIHSEINGLVFDVDREPRIQAMPSLFNESGQRIVFPEIIYLCYTALNSLIVFAAYWIWKKKIKL